MNQLPVLQPPRKRSDCSTGVRPCPWVRCRYNLFLEVNKHGAIHYNFKDAADPFEVQTSTLCALDYAKSPKTLEEVGEAFGVTRERIRQLEAKALRRLIQQSQYNPEIRAFFEGSVDPKTSTWDD